MKVYVKNTQDILDCEVLKENFYTIILKLPNKDIIKKHKYKNLINKMINISKIESGVVR